MIDKKTREKLENMRGLCMINKQHKFQYVKENKKGEVTMSCIDCSNGKKFTNKIVLNIKNKKGKMSGFLTFFVVILIALFIFFIVATGVILKWG